MPPSVMDNPTGRFWNEKKSCQDIKHSPLWAGDAEGTGQRASATCGRKDKRQSGTRLESSAPLAWRCRTLRSVQGPDPSPGAIYNTRA